MKIPPKLLAWFVPIGFNYPVGEEIEDLLEVCGYYVRLCKSSIVDVR